MIAKAIRWLILLAILVMLFPYQVSAAGIGVSPGRLDFNVYSWGSATKTLHVFNARDSETHYKAYMAEEYEDWFDLAPDEFSIPPQASQEVLITVSPPFLSFGGETYLYIVTTGSPLPLGINMGIKVPIHIHISYLPLLVGIGIATLIVTVVIFLMKRRPRRKGGEVIQQD